MQHNSYMLAFLFYNHLAFAFSALMLLGGRKGIRPVKAEW